jgi:hypothetical protein
MGEWIEVIKIIKKGRGKSRRKEGQDVNKEGRNDGWIEGRNIKRGEERAAARKKRMYTRKDVMTRHLFFSHPPAIEFGQIHDRRF